MALDKVVESIFSRKEKLDEIEVLMLINKILLEEDELMYFALDMELMEEETNANQKENWEQCMRLHNLYMNIC